MRLPGPLLLAIAALGITPSAAAPDRNPAAREMALERARASMSALEHTFAAGDGLYREHAPTQPGDSRYSTEWPFSQAHIALLDLAALPGVEGGRYKDALATARTAQQAYWSETSKTGLAGYLSEVAPPLGHGGDLYYDDNEWVGLAQIQHYLFTGDRTALERAQRVFDLVRSGWSTGPLHPPGGVMWTQQAGNNDRGTVSNMPGAELGVRLYLITHDRRYLNDALRFYLWANTTFQRPDGLYLDHLTGAGVMDERIYTYNQGVPVGVNLLLWRATKDPRYLAEAKRIADASVAWFVDGGRLDDQPPPFNAIYFKNLLLLARVSGEPRYAREMRAYAERMWATRRDPKTGVHRAKQGRAELIDLAAMVQINAVLAWRESDWDKLY